MRGRKRRCRIFNLMVFGKTISCQMVGLQQTPDEPEWQNLDRQPDSLRTGWCFDYPFPRSSFFPTHSQDSPSPPGNSGLRLKCVPDHGLPCIAPGSETDQTADGDEHGGRYGTDQQGNSSTVQQPFLFLPSFYRCLP